MVAEQLRGLVASLATQKNGNHVVQKVIELLPLSRVSFIPEELSQTGHAVLQDLFGVRAILRLVEHFASDERATRLTNGFLERFDENVEHPCAHWVIEALLEHGTVEQKHDIADRLKRDFVRLANHEVAWHVVDKALRSELDFQDRQDLISMKKTNRTRWVGR